MIRVISLGAGTQSTTLAFLAATGAIEMPDCAIFADTGEEPLAVYEHLRWLVGAELQTITDDLGIERKIAKPGVYQSGQLPFPTHVAAAWLYRAGIRGPLGDEMLRATRGERGFHARPPVYVSNFRGDTKGGMVRRQCTGDYKIDVIQAKERVLLGLKRRRPWPKEILISQWIGISTDEATRAKPVMVRRAKTRQRPAGMYPHPTIEGRWPLLELRMSRRDCERWLVAHGYPIPPKSACAFCPFHSDAEWRHIRDTDAPAWRRSIRIDEEIRTGIVQKALRGELFLHRSLKPLAEADLSTAEERGQANLFENECAGVCGV